MDDHGSADCPSCGWPAPAGAGPCLHCCTARPPAPDPEPVDPLDGAALTVAELRGFIESPDTPADRAAARRFLDRQAEERRPR
jgi:hypothetical protein